MVHYSSNPLSGFLPSLSPPTSEPAPTDTASLPRVPAGPMSKPGLDNEVAGEEGCRRGTEGPPIRKRKERMGSDIRLGGEGPKPRGGANPKRRPGQGLWAKYYMALGYLVGGAKGSGGRNRT